MLGTKPGAMEYLVGVSLVMKECSWMFWVRERKEERVGLSFWSTTTTTTTAASRRRVALAPLYWSCSVSQRLTSSRVRCCFPEVIVAS